MSATALTASAKLRIGACSTLGQKHGQKPLAGRQGGQLLDLVKAHHPSFNDPALDLQGFMILGELMQDLGRSDDILLAEGDRRRPRQVLVQLAQTRLRGGTAGQGVFQ